MDQEPSSSGSMVKMQDVIETIVLTNMPIEEENEDDPTPMELENSDGQLQIIPAHKVTKVEIKGEDDTEEEDANDGEDEEYIDEEEQEMEEEDEEEVEDVKPVVEPNYCKLCQRSFKTPAVSYMII